MVKFCIANRKGGVGKTTITVNLAAALGRVGKTVLIIDLDSQRGNATRSLGMADVVPEESIGEVLINRAPIEQAIKETQIKNIWLVPAHPGLTAAPEFLASQRAADLRLQAAMKGMRQHFDYVIIDCGPSLDVLTTNGLVASDYVLAPMEPEPLALDGIVDLLNAVQEVQELISPSLQFGAVIINRPNPLPTNIGRQTLDKLVELDVPIAETVIPSNVRLQEAQEAGVSVFEVDPECASAKAFEALAQEVLAWQIGQRVG